MFSKVSRALLQKNSLAGAISGSKPETKGASSYLEVFLAGEWLQGLVLFSGVLKGSLGLEVEALLKCLTSAGWLE
jgi:hypothetical protein